MLERQNYLNQNHLKLNAYLFDDFKANAIDDNSDFSYARRLKELFSKLQDGILCIVSDIDFCRVVARQEAEKCILQKMPEVEIEWWFFANDPEACKRNIIQRGRNIKTELNNVDRYARQYEIPSESKIIPVWPKICV